MIVLLGNAREVREVPLRRARLRPRRRLEARRLRARRLQLVVLVLTTVGTISAVTAVISSDIFQGNPIEIRKLLLNTSSLKCPGKFAQTH